MSVLGLLMCIYSGEVVFSKRLGFLETRSDVDGIMADIRTKVSYGGTVCDVPKL